MSRVVYDAPASEVLPRLRRLQALEHQLRSQGRPDWKPEPYQLAPQGDWGLWLFLAGRGTGKTDACAFYVDNHMTGPPCDTRLPGGHRIAIIAPTLGDALESCVNGPSGLKAHNPGVRSAQSTGGTYVRWPSGAEAKLFGADGPGDVDRLRAGGNRCLAWLEELAAWRYLESSWNHMRFGLRVGPHPRVVASTTPKSRLLIRAAMGKASAKEMAELLGDPPMTVAVTRASTSDNPHLDPSVRDALYATYRDTRLGRQELGGELLEDVEGALWTGAMIDGGRVPAHPDLVRVVVAIDPAVTASTDSDATGIIVAGKGVDGLGYVLADRSCKLSPDGWARRAVAAYGEFAADRIVAEVNNGGDMVESTLRVVDAGVSYRKLHASRGKQTRAEPIAALYEQGKIHHVGAFAELEDELTQWTPESGDSPDRLDALVWAMTDLMLGGSNQVAVGTAPGRLAVRPSSRGYSAMSRR